MRNVQRCYGWSYILRGLKRNFDLTVVKGKWTSKVNAQNRSDRIELEGSVNGVNWRRERGSKT